MTFFDWSQILAHIVQLEQEGRVTRTFRRLDPDRQRTVITAILDEAVEKGPTSLNIKQVAERAGVSVGSLYTYFGNRAGLLEFTVELCVRFMNDMFNYARPFLLALPLREGLAAYLAGGVEWARMQAGLIRFFARAAYHSDSELSEQVVRPVASTMRELVRDMLTAAIQRGEVRPDIDLEATARLIHALTIAVGDSQILPYLNTYFQVTDADTSSERAVAALAALVLNGIGVQTRQDTP
jgi:AcrR family transcriptional regulator